MRNYWDALVGAGFTEDQATQIVAGFASKPDKQAPWISASAPIGLKT